MSNVEGAVKAVVLGGKTGMLGRSLVNVLQGHGWDVTAQGREGVDVLDADALEKYLEALSPDFVFNSIAYTAVDDAEDEPEQAFLLNKTLPENLGKLSLKLKFWLIHYSTDFVFDGKNETPYVLSNNPNPVSVYGRSKLGGESALLQAGVPTMSIIRTAWLFGSTEKKNFVKTMITLARTRDELTVVHDQVGSPTYTDDLAEYSYELAKQKHYGIFHLVNSGQCSWCELAAEAINLAGLNCTVNAIPSSDYPTKATRPKYSVLSTEKFTKVTGVTPRPWPQALRDYVYKDFSDLSADDELYEE